MTVRKESIWGKRRARLRPPETVINDAMRELERLRERKKSLFSSIPELRDSFVPVSQAYFSLAALTRRNSLESDIRNKALSLLFKTRTLIESKMLEELQRNSDSLDIFKAAIGGAFFGKSKKQGVSIRYALSSCMPTSRCGGSCYAHDGRDRELLHIFRGVLNYYIGLEFENGSKRYQFEIMNRLDKPLKEGVSAAVKDAEIAALGGFNRAPRIRFSHVGEMAATPRFTNALAQQVKSLAPSISCVIYTRHPRARMLDTNYLIVNFTLEGISDNRSKHVPRGSRIVNSAWDGYLNSKAEVNFLEHHVEKASISKGVGSVCPVTANHKKTPSCDIAHCVKCFVPPGKQELKQLVKHK
jgi:hypothetical protein